MPLMNEASAIRVIETALICSKEPISTRELRTLFEDAFSIAQITSMLHALQLQWQDRGMALVSVTTGWRFQSRPEFAVFLERVQPEKPPRLTRAALETLAIIAYRQPVTRGDIEGVRGVVVNSFLLEQLEERGWIEVVGRRQSIGRPELFATTRHFLDDLGFDALSQLPAIEDPQAFMQAVELIG